MKIKRIAYIANARLPTEKAHGYQICKMCEAFAQNGVNVILLHPERHQSNPELKRKSVFDYYSLQSIFEVHTLPNWDVVTLNAWIPSKLFTGIFFTHGMLWGLYAALKAAKTKANLYYTRDISIAFWLTKLGLPTVYEAHTVPKRVQRWFLQQLIRNSALQQIVVLTSFIKKELIEIGFPSEKILVEPDAVDLSLFSDLPSKETCRQRLELPQERAIIGYIGRFHTMGKEKGIPELIQAMAQVPLIDGKEPLLLCVGGPMEVVPNYLEIARRFNIPEHRLKFIDRVPNREVPTWLRTFDIAVAPFPYSEHYAYFMSPLKIFEYMAAGTPIITSDLPSIGEVLKHGENSWLVEPGSFTAIAQGIQHLMRNGQLRHNLVHQSLKDIQYYTWNARASRIIKSFE